MELLIMQFLHHPGALSLLRPIILSRTLSAYLYFNEIYDCTVMTHVSPLQACYCFRESL
jgi:hypothetical protein